MAGEWMFLTPEYILQDMPIDFFDFQFTMNADGSMKECKYWEQVLRSMYLTKFIPNQREIHEESKTA